MFSGSGKNIAVLSMIDRDLICLSDGAAGIVYVSKFVDLCRTTGTLCRNRYGTTANDPFARTKPFPGRNVVVRRFSRVLIDSVHVYIFQPFLPIIPCVFLFRVADILFLFFVVVLYYIILYYILFIQSFIHSFNI
jgi:hypothetical protein